MDDLSCQIESEIQQFVPEADVDDLAQRRRLQEQGHACLGNVVTAHSTEQALVPQPNAQ